MLSHLTTAPTTQPISKFKASFFILCTNSRAIVVLFVVVDVFCAMSSVSFALTQMTASGNVCVLPLLTVTEILKFCILNL